jgi:protein subunit release factor A
LNIIEFLQDDRRQCLEELSKTHNRSVEIQKENQELKSQLAGTTHCFDEEEHRKLKDEIKKLERIIELCHLDAKETLATINYEQELQKKEFINYLQKEINRYNAHIDAVNSVGISIYSPDYDNSKLKLAIFKEVLLKYIETIQTKNDKSV